MREHFLSRVFNPASVAVVGASDRETSVGYRLLRNLLDAGFEGAIYPVNDQRTEVQGIKAWPSIASLENSVDLVVMAVPAADIPDLVRQAGEQGARAVLIVSAGFGEAGSIGQQLEDKVLEVARRYDLRVLGPNCLGIIRPRHGLNVSYTRNEVKPGRVALVAQSGAFTTALLDWAGANGFGFSVVASLGAATEVSVGQVLDYLALDESTQSVLLYLEGVGDARAFLSGLASVARVKPVVVVKAGRSSEAHRSAAAHHELKPDNDSAFDAAIQRAGAVRVQTVTQLFSAARILASGFRVRGSRLAVLTNGAGPGLMAADRAMDRGIPLAELLPETVEELARLLPTNWEAGNPLDLLGDADGPRYRDAANTLLADRGVDGVLCLLAPQGATDPDACAEGLAESVDGQRKPIVAAWMGEERVWDARARLTEAGIPHFTSPEAGVDAFANLAAYHRNQEILIQSPPPLSAHELPDLPNARQLVATGARRFVEGEDLGALMAAFRIRFEPGAELAAEGSDSLSLRIERDSTFGPIIRLGPGGALSGLGAETRVALPPLNLFLCKELIGRSPVQRLRCGFHHLVSGKLPALVDLLMRLSEMACELPEIQQLEFNPVRVAADEVLVAGAVVELAPVTNDAAFYRHMAIHPYPASLETTLTLRDGSELPVRPIRPEDAEIERAAVDGLSPESRYNRFMYQMGKITPRMLARFTQIDYDREMALIGVLNDNTPEAQMVAVVRYVTNPDGESCEFALTVVDDWQARGLGSRMMHLLMDAARERGLKTMEGDVLATNRKMLRLCERLGFSRKRSPEDAGVVIVSRPL